MGEQSISPSGRHKAEGGPSRLPLSLLSYSCWVPSPLDNVTHTPGGASSLNYYAPPGNALQTYPESDFPPLLGSCWSHQAVHQDREWAVAALHIHSQPLSSCISQECCFAPAVSIHIIVIATLAIISLSVVMTYGDKIYKLLLDLL